MHLVQGLHYGSKPMGANHNDPRKVTKKCPDLHTQKNLGHNSNFFLKNEQKSKFWVSKFQNTWKVNNPILRLEITQQWVHNMKNIIFLPHNHLLENIHQIQNLVWAITALRKLTFYCLIFLQEYRSWWKGKFWTLEDHIEYIYPQCNFLVYLTHKNSLARK